MKGSDGLAQAVLRDLDAEPVLRSVLPSNFLFIEFTPQLKLDFSTFETILHTSHYLSYAYAYYRKFG